MEGALEGLTAEERSPQSGCKPARGNGQKRRQRRHD